MTSIERTAYPQFKRLTSARVLHVFFTPTAEESAWARERTKEPAALFALVLDLKCFQKMARFCSREEIPDVVVDHVRRCLGPPVVSSEKQRFQPFPQLRTGLSELVARRV